LTVCTSQAPLRLGAGRMEDCRESRHWGSCGSVFVAGVWKITDPFGAPPVWSRRVPAGLSLIGACLLAWATFSACWLCSPLRRWGLWGALLIFFIAYLGIRYSALRARLQLLSVVSAPWPGFFIATC